VTGNPSIAIRSTLPGRTRFEVRELLDRLDVCMHVEQCLTQAPQVHSASASAITGRILVVYNSRLSALDVQSYLEHSLTSAHQILATKPAGNARPVRNGKLGPLIQLAELTRNQRHLALVAIGVAVGDRLFEATPSAMIGAAMDLVTKDAGKSLLARLGFRSLTSRLTVFGIVCAVVWTLDAFMGYLHRVTSTRFAQAVQDEHRNRIYQHLQSLDVGQLEGKPLSHWTRLFDTEIGQIGDFLETGIDPLITMLTNSAIVLTTFLRNSPALLLTQLLIIPGLYLLSSRMLGPIRKRYILARERSDRLSVAIAGNIAGASTITVFGTQEQEAKRIEVLSKQAEEAAEERASLTATYVPLIQMVVGIGFLSTLIGGGALVKRGRLSMASYNMMGFSSLKLMVAFGSLGSSLAEYQRTVVSIERVTEALRTESTVRSGDMPFPSAKAADVQFEDVSFEYLPGKPVLQNVQLRIASRGTTAIVGSSGSGKTTLLKLILRFYNPTQGAITAKGKDIRDLKIDDFRSHISLVPQDVFLVQGTVRENIAYSRRSASLDAVIRAARAAQAHEFIRGLSNGYDTVLGEGGVSLSVGQQQRIAIARTILANRQIVLFDEATSALDYDTEAAIQQTLQKVLSGHTTVIVAHRLSTVRHADWIYVLEDGQIAEQGRHEELLMMHGIYARLWQIQTGEDPEGSYDGRGNE